MRHFKLPERTYEDRPVEGIEISKNVRRKDGKPVFLMMGVHHAREWPSGEHAIEWAYELINGFKDGDKRIRKIVKRSRTIVVPIVNPDGFETSREAGELEGGGGGRGGDDTQETVNIVSHPFEYRRKNCRLVDDSEAGNCAQPSVGLAEPGVDPNRNYGGFWGGPGASTDPTAQDYRGPGPFSEPETRNIKWLVSRNQVTTLITNHTFSGLVLRPPGIQSQGPPPDEKIYKQLGAKMAAENGYANQPSYKLYDTTGGTEDWSYYATGGLGFTFEIGKNFHPPFADVVAEYRGTTPEAGDGGGNRAAYFKAERNTLKRKRHSVIKGQAPAGAKLTLSQAVQDEDLPRARRKRRRGRRDQVQGSPADEAQGRQVRPLHLARQPLDAADRAQVQERAEAPQRAAQRPGRVQRLGRRQRDALRRRRDRGRDVLQRPSVHRARRPGHRQRHRQRADPVGDARLRLGHEDLPRHATETSPPSARRTRSASRPRARPTARRRRSSART